MAGVFLVIVPTEEFERYCRDREETSSLNKTKNATESKSETSVGRVPNGSTQQQQTPPPQYPTDAAGQPAYSSSDGQQPQQTPVTTTASNPNVGEPHWKSPGSLMKALEESLQQQRITDAVWHRTKESPFYQVIFTCESQERAEEILRTLYQAGIGRLYESTVCILPCSFYYEGRGCGEKSDDKDYPSETESEAGEDDELHPKDDVKSLRRQFIRSIKARLTVAQVVEGVKAGALLTFDFIMFVAIASLIAALGLVEDSPVVVVASMLISPIMGPIMAWTFGTVIQDHGLQRIGIKSELIGLSICIVTGFLFGLVCGPLDRVWGGRGQLPTTEMQSRGKLRVLWVGMLIALPSGAGVALSILGGNASSLVGVAISASLLPPCVNAGLLWAYSLVIYLRSFSEDDVTQEYMNRSLTNRPSLLPMDGYIVQYSYDMMTENLLLGVVSLLLSFINILCIIFMAIMVFKIKEVAPYTTVATTARFWREDIKITRDYNRTMQGHEAKKFAKTFVEEWAAINNINPGDHTSKTNSQLNYLRNVVEEAEEDEVYQTVIRCIGHPMPIDPVTATLGSLNRTTWPHPGYQRGSMKKPKVWDIDFNPRGNSMRRRMFSDPGDSYTPLHTISETEVEGNGSDVDVTPSTRCPGDTVVSMPSQSSIVASPVQSPPSSSGFASAPSRLLRSLMGRRFVVTRAVDDQGGRRKSKRAHTDQMV